MDTFGRIYLVVVVIALVAALVGFWYLSRRGPRGSVLIVAISLYVVGSMLEPSRSREIVGLIGILKVTGFIGGILGIIDLIRRSRGTPDGRT